MLSSKQACAQAAVRRRRAAPLLLGADRRAITALRSYRQESRHGNRQPRLRPPTATALWIAAILMLVAIVPLRLAGRRRVAPPAHTALVVAGAVHAEPAATAGARGGARSIPPTARRRRAAGRARADLLRPREEDLMADRDLLQLLLRDAGRRAALVLNLRPAAAPPRHWHPEAGAGSARPMSSWLPCGLPAASSRFAYSACAVRDAALTSSSASTLRPRCGAAGAARARALDPASAARRRGPWLGRVGRVGAAGVDATAAGCRQLPDWPAGPRRPRTRNRRHRCHRRGSAWLRRHVLNPRAAALYSDDGEPQRWIEPRQAFDCLGPLAVRVDGRPRGRRAVPSTPFVLEWRAANSARWLWAALPLSGRITLQVRDPPRPSLRSSRTR